MKNTHPRTFHTPTGVGGDGCAAEVTNGGGDNGIIARRECAATTPPNFEDGGPSSRLPFNATHR